MCRNIKMLANFAPTATDDEICASSLQFVWKLSGANRPSMANELAFNRAVEEVTAAAHRLVDSLTTTARHEIVNMNCGRRLNVCARGSPEPLAAPI
jgi:hypothetical protein